MSTRLEQLADRGDARIAKWSEKHLPQSEEAIRRRERTKDFLGKSALVAGGVALAAGAVLGINKFVDVAADHADRVAEQDRVWEEELEEAQRQGAIELGIPPITLDQLDADS